MLVQEQWLPDLLPLLAEWPDVPVYVGEAAVLEKLTGYNLHRGALAAMHRPPLASVADPALASIVSERTADLPTIGTVTNTNKLLGKHGVTGLKTGTTDEAGACLLFSAEFAVGSETITLVGVVLGGTDHTELNDSISALIESVKPGFREVTLTDKGAAYASYDTKWGQESQAVAAKAASVLVWSDTPVTAVAQAHPITLGDAGDSVGAVDFAVGGRTISVPLVLDKTISDPGPEWRFSHPGELAAVDK